MQRKSRIAPRTDDMLMVNMTQPESNDYEDVAIVVFLRGSYFVGLVNV